MKNIITHRYGGFDAYVRQEHVEGSGGEAVVRAAGAPSPSLTNASIGRPVASNLVCDRFWF